MLDLVEKVVDGKKYLFHRLPVSLSLKILIRISKIIGPVMGSVFDGLGDDVPGTMKELLDSDIDFSKITTSLFSTIDEDITISTIQELLAHVMYEGSKVSDIFEVHFQKDIPHLLKLVGVALEVEYGNFFVEGGLISAIRNQNNQSQEKNTTPEKQTATG